MEIGNYDKEKTSYLDKVENNVIEKIPIKAELEVKMVFCYQNCFDLCTVRKNCSSDQEKLLKYEAEGREFEIFSRSLEQFIQTVKGQNNFW